MKNVCNLAKHWLWTVWRWHKSVETRRSTYYTYSVLWYILLWDNCAFAGIIKNKRDALLHVLK